MKGLLQEVLVYLERSENGQPYIAAAINEVTGKPEGAEIARFELAEKVRKALQ